MNIKLSLALVLLITVVISFGFSEELHCWRQDISRAVSVNYSFSEFYLDSVSGLIVPTTAKLNVSGFGNYEYRCEDGASGQSNNYIEIYDNKTGAVVRTNGVRGVEGPSGTGGPVMCVVPGTNDACYISNGERYPGRGECEKGDVTVGAGVQDVIEVMMTDFRGEQDWTIRVGIISPAGSGINAGSPRITFRDLNRLQFTVDSSKPAVLVFPPLPLQKMNAYDKSADLNKEIYFTLLNKARIPSVINSYSIQCPTGLTCELEQYEGHNMYDGWNIEPNQAIVIPVKVTISKNSLPASFAAIMTVKFTPKGLATCDADGCTATSSAVRFEAGLIDQQKFQLNVSNQTEQKYCVDYEGHLGRTGSDYAPRINLYFGGNNPLTANPNDNLISLNECSPVNYETGLANPDWVYCTQNEFMVQLGARLGLFSQNLTAISDSLARGDLADAEESRALNAKLKTFEVYLRDFDFNKESRNSSVQEMFARLNDVSFTKIGFALGEVQTNDEFKLLADKIQVYRKIEGVTINDAKITSGKYKVTIDMNETGGQDLGGLFLSDGSFNPNISIKIYLEKVAEPKLDWVFYYTKDNYGDELYTPSVGTDYITNFSDRGTIMRFEKTNKTIVNKNFYSTFAVPLIMRIVNNEELSASDASFTAAISGNSTYAGEVFSVWTGFASSLGNGCGTTVINPKIGGKALPYRIIDSSKGNGIYEITDLNSVQAGSKMYVETVLYLSEQDLLLQLPFRAFSLFADVDGTKASPQSLIIDGADYSTYTIDSLSDVLEGIKDQKVCVYFDNSTSKEEWKLFWNQDKVLDDLKVTAKPKISDATICQSREVQSS
jgi:hypothetical protein